MQKSCGASAPSIWEPPVVVDPGSSGYSSVRVREVGPPGASGVAALPKLYDLWAWCNNSGTVAPAGCKGSSLVGGIRFAEVGFPPCGAGAAGQKGYCP